MSEGYRQYSAIKNLLEKYNVNFKDDKYQYFMSELATILRI